ncbi:MAG: cysteine peptidase family C39 domain-containing protein [Proteobacteria bacterium]|nr:cysteine peptidase family C39 domain-containing protein [Pseudomonadota bacterium]
MLKRALEGLAHGLGYLRQSSDDIVLDLRPRLQLDGHSCGLQSLAAILDYYDFEIDLEELADDLGLTDDGVVGYGDDSVLVMDPLPQRAFLRGGRRDLEDFFESWDRWGIAVHRPRRRTRAAKVMR